MDIRSRPSHTDRGSISVEMTALVFPTMVILTMLLIGVWRLSAAHLDVRAAAAAAARAASQQRTVTDAEAAAIAAANADLATRHRTCDPLTVNVDASDFHRGGSVQVTLTCHITTHDLIGLDAPGGSDTHAEARAPIETYRELQQL